MSNSSGYREYANQGLRRLESGASGEALAYFETLHSALGAGPLAAVPGFEQLREQARSATVARIGAQRLDQAHAPWDLWFASPSWLTVSGGVGLLLAVGLSSRYIKRRSLLVLPLFACIWLGWAAQEAARHPVRYVVLSTPVRSGPGEQFGTASQLEPGMAVHLMPELAASAPADGSWIPVRWLWRWNAGRAGWVPRASVLLPPEAQSTTPKP